LTNKKESYIIYRADKEVRNPKTRVSVSFFYAIKLGEVKREESVI